MLRKQEELSVFAKIKGIGAASGLFLNQNLLYIISDNGAYLYQYNILDQHLKKFLLLPDQVTRHNIPKAIKPDFEVLCHYEQKLYILGSGSTGNRNLLIEYHLETQKIVKRSLAKFYASLKKSFAIDSDNLNIEGAIFTGSNWFLFNRGNGNAKKNGIFKIQGRNLEATAKVTFTPLLLLTSNVLATFTDAVLHEDQLYFLAAAEDTTSTYDDGEIQGSYIGSLDLETLNLNFTKKISAHQKFEGITFFKRDNNQIEFLLCEDTDQEISETLIYKLTI